MRTWNRLAIIVLGAIFVALAIFLVITMAQGDHTAQGGTGAEHPRQQIVHTS